VQRNNASFLKTGILFYFVLKPVFHLVTFRFHPEFVKPVASTDVGICFIIECFMQTTSNVLISSLVICADQNILFQFWRLLFNNLFKTTIFDFQDRSF
jgi:hypothetical protein